MVELTQARDEDGVYAEFEELLSNTTNLLWRLAESIADAYFSHSQTSQLMSHAVREEEL